VIRACALALALGLTASAASADVASVLDALETAGRGLKTMRAQFVETRVLALLDESSESRGEVLLEIPGRFRWNYTSPQPSVTVVKDGRFARYFPQSKQVFRGAARGEADLLVGFGPGAAGLGKKYEATLVGEERIGAILAHVLDLKPRPGQGGLFAGIRLWVDASRFIPIQTRLTEPTGDHTTVRFEHVVVNGPLKPHSFDLALPKGVVEVQ
jgi:outer membrane lipoprotein-sorting protein